MESSMAKLLRLIYLSVLVISSFMSCVHIPEDFRLPEWETDVNLPIVNRAYSIIDLADSDSTGANLKIVNDDVVVYYTIHDTIAATEFIPLLDTNAMFKLLAKDGIKTFFIVVPFPEGIIINETHISEGKIFYEISKITDNNSEPISFNLFFDNFYFENGKQVTRYINMTDKVLTDSMDISKTKYYGVDQNSQRFIGVKAKDIAGKDSFYVKITIKDAKLSYFDGNFPSKLLEQRNNIYTISINAKADTMRKNFKITEGELKLTSTYLPPLANRFGISFDTCSIFGMNDSSIQLKRKNNTAIIGKETIYKDTTVLLDNNNSNITDVFNFGPDSISFTANERINPEYKPGIVSDQDSIFIKGSFEVKSRFKLNEVTFIDSVNLDYDTNDVVEYADKVIKALLTLKVVNSSPIEGNLDFILKDSTTFFTGTMKINSPTIVDGIVTKEITDTASYNLSGEQVKRLVRLKKIYLLWKIKTSGDEYVLFKPENGLKITSYTSIRYKVSED